MARPAGAPGAPPAPPAPPPVNPRDRVAIEGIVAVAPPTLFRVAPDVRSVAYVDEVAGARQLCLLPLRGGGPRVQLTASARDVTDVAWSPDGSRLAYVCETAIWWSMPTAGT
ncbi:MAG TPA: hypothetical protein VMH24_06665 [Candidatus Sulfotelmatobacter sp.]|nr:hypothetical protein [Candidatus Sulfotelmatobacter sp.]